MNNMGHIICIDLTKFNNEKLSEVSKLHSLDLDSLIKDKKSGFVKIYIDTQSGVLVAFTHKDSRNEITIADVFKNAIKTVEPIELKKKNKTLKVLTIDGVLDKISKYGIESLSDIEKEFLNENSNNI
jgi:hypothetical protein